MEYQKLFQTAATREKELDIQFKEKGIEAKSSEIQALSLQYAKALQEAANGE